MGSHIVTCYPTHVNAPRLNPSQASQPTPEGWKAELTFVVGYIPTWFTCPQTVIEFTVVRLDLRNLNFNADLDLDLDLLN